MKIIATSKSIVHDGIKHYGEFTIPALPGSYSRSGQDLIACSHAVKFLLKDRITEKIQLEFKRKPFDGAIMLHPTTNCHVVCPPELAKCEAIMPYSGWDRIYVYEALVKLIRRYGEYVRVTPVPRTFVYSVRVSDMTHDGEGWSENMPLRQYSFQMSEEKSDLAVVRKAKELAGYSGVSCRREEYGDTIALTPVGQPHIRIFIDFDEEETNKANKADNE